MNSDHVAWTQRSGDDRECKTLRTERNGSSSSLVKQLEGDDEESVGGAQHRLERKKLLEWDQPVGVYVEEEDTQKKISIKIWHEVEPHYTAVVKVQCMMDCQEKPAQTLMVSYPLTLAQRSFTFNSMFFSQNNRVMTIISSSSKHVTISLLVAAVTSFYMWHLKLYKTPTCTLKRVHCAELKLARTER